MARQYTHITKKLKDFIEAQKIFFVATATAESKINLSPKGMDTFRVLDKKRAIWLNLTGSGNETAAHLNINNRITIMFCSFEGAPLILRLYGKGRLIHKKNDDWDHLIKLFPTFIGARQLIDIKIELVQTSCGMSVPYFDFKEERDQLKDWAENKGDDGIKVYWQEKNQFSIDGLTTNIKKNY